jgi:hypothetical protein
VFRTQRGTEGMRRIAVPAMLALLLALAQGAPPAAAQEGPVTAYLDAVDAWATAQSLRRMLPDSGQTGREIRKSAKARAKEVKPTKAQLHKLRFVRDPAVTEANNQAVIGELGPGYDPAVVVSDIERNRDLMHGMMRSFSGRWSPNDLADVAATALLGGYAAYHGVATLSGPGCLAVRASARNGLAKSKRIRGLPAERKQTAAEMTEIRLIYLIAQLNAARAANDTIVQDTVRYQIRGWIRDVYSLDVDAVKLTKRGFVGG